MSAICGRLHLDGSPADTVRIQASLDAMARYGPDGAGQRSDGTVAFGHQLHALLPESVGIAQPVHLAGPDLTITADARIDNREDLARAFGLDHAEVADWPDERYILAAYEKWGTDCVEKLLGDFAFALWDGRNRRLLLARDFIGARPLYYAVDGKRVAFASDVLGALEAAGLPQHLDPDSLREQFYRGSQQNKERTFFSNLAKLPPGHWLAADESGVRTHRYWDPANVADRQVGSEDNAIAEILDLVTDATRCRTRSTRPVGAHASGGLDSSTLAVLAARILGESDRSLTAINWAPPFTDADLPLDPDKDERATVEALVQAEPNIESCYTPLTAKDLAEGWAADITLHPSTTLRWEYRASKEAAARGVGVVLSGWGGDETIAFNGRGFFSDLARRGRWIRLARELRLRSQIHPVKFWGLRRKVILPLMSDGMVRVLLPKHADGRTNKTLANCLTPELRTLMEGIELETRSGRERPGRRRMQEVLLELGHLNLRAESWNDHGANLNIEYRFPVLDRRVVEFSLGGPDWLFFNNGWKRYAFRKSMEGLVPADAQWKKRKGDPAMVAGMAGQTEPAKKLQRLAILAREPHVRAAGLLDYDAFLDGYDNDHTSAQQMQAGGSRPTLQGSQFATWLAFATGTMG